MRFEDDFRFRTTTELSLKIAVHAVYTPFKKSNATRLFDYISFILGFYPSSLVSLESLFICLSIDALFVRVVLLGRTQAE